ncbi:type 1 fimbrial protein [Pseudomonas sp. C2B4]|uniref:type 1 fimbrial protein n=1 Tax=Pseudomonas sp. C2B4 TaxID=2735270 RepID=UPI001586513F|nr:type 1 fimbrial protein [Pseudomonas sp. C2B4]NUU37832.1 type 1 fimbrial protein [Pseudomonas sp. C2B4]
MNRKRISIGLGLLVGLSWACFASTQAEWRISFQGSIVETPCNASIAGDDLALQDCPAMARIYGISIRNVEPVHSITLLYQPEPHVKLIAESEEGPGKFGRQYGMLDAANKPINSGMYLVTLTYP